METLKQWALGVCAAAIFSSVIYALAPKGSMQKALRCVTALAVVCAIVLPLASAMIKLELPKAQQKVDIPTELSRDMEYQLTAAYSQQLCAQAQEILESCGIFDCEIDALTDIDETGSISIKKVNIILPEDAQVPNAAQGKLCELFGEDTVIDMRFRSTY